MSLFDKAFDYVLRREGGLNEDANDSGGITKFGISYRFLRSLPEKNLRRYGIRYPVDEDTICNLTLEQARAIYFGEFWDGRRFEEIQNERVRHYLFDMAVSHAHAQAIKLVQRSTWALTLKRDYLPDDGILGDMTIGVLNVMGEAVIPVMVATRAAFYRMLVKLRPKDIVYLNGWLTRCYNP